MFDAVRECAYRAYKHLEVEEHRLEYLFLEITRRCNLTHEQTWRMLDWIAERRPHYAARGLEVSASCEGYVTFAEDKKIRDLPFFCRAGINVGSILCDGQITGCTNNHASFYQGNILEDDLAEVWATRFESYRRRDWVAATQCSGCAELEKCQGGSIHLWRRDADAPAFCYLPGSPVQTAGRRR